MSQDEIPCGKCGKLVRKDLTYCNYCGSFLEPALTSSPTPIQPTSSTPPPITPIKTKKKIPYKTITYFAVVAVIDLLVSFLVMSGFELPVSSFGQLYLTFFFVVAFSLGILWLAGSHSSFSGGSGGVSEGCAYCIGAILGILIVVPVLLIVSLSLGPAVIGNAVKQRFSDVIENAFGDVEIPGFEPLLFLGLFAMLSIIIMYRYHLKTKKNSLSN